MADPSHKSARPPTPGRAMSVNAGHASRRPHVAHEQHMHRMLSGVGAGALTRGRGAEAMAAAEISSASERVFIELGERVSALVGSQGYRSLLDRSLAMASANFSVLRAVRPGLSPPGRLVGLRKRPGGDLAAGAEDALAATLSALVSLLERFIGRDLTQVVLRDVRRAPALIGQAAAGPRRLPRPTRHW